MSIRVFITDLDGTLLRSDQTISEASVDILTNALDQDIVISYATARGFISANSVAAAVPWKYPVILYNGALIYDGINNKVIDGYWLDNKTTETIIEIGKRYNITPFYFALDVDDNERVLHETLVREGDMQFHLSRENDPRFMEVEALKCPIDHRTLTLSYIGLLEEVEPVLEEVTKCLGNKVYSHIMKDYYIENHYFLEFSHPMANKKDGLRLWAKNMNVSTEDIVIFGDNLNDIGLFEIAGYKVAVNNAQERIKELSDEIIGSNDEDGVAKYIQERVKST
jgi:Cof subfamily protein (haloacid dehalogenase superfamily)